MAQAGVCSAVILAAGRGDRFWPYNVVRQKAAFPIANVPVVRRMADALVQLGITRLIVVVGPGEASVRHALRGCAGEVVFVRQGETTGTATAVLAAAPHLEGDFLVAAGDVVTHPDNLKRLVERFAAERPMAACLVDALGDEPPQSWLVAHMNGAAIAGVEGHPRHGSHRLTGVYVMRSEALGYLRDNPGVMSRVPVGGMPPAEAEIAQSIQMMVDECTHVLAVETTGYFVDLDKPWHVLVANQRVIEWMASQVEGNVIPASSRVHDGAEIDGRLVLGENCVIGNRVAVRGDLWMANGSQVINGAILDGSVVVGADTIVRDYCQLGGMTTVGPRGVYGHGAEFTGVALETVYCYHYCEIWGVVGQAVDFGAATVCGNLRFDDAATVWRVNGQAEQPAYGANAAYFGDFCRTGVNAIIMPGRRIGVYAVVGAGVVAYDDVPDRQLLLLKQELATRSWGPERYGW